MPRSIGRDELRAAMIAVIPWTQMEKRTSPRIFKLIKDEILRLRDEGQVLHTFKELRKRGRRPLETSRNLSPQDLSIRFRTDYTERFKMC